MADKYYWEEMDHAKVRKKASAMFTVASGLVFSLPLIGNLISPAKAGDAPGVTENHQAATDISNIAGIGLGSTSIILLGAAFRQEKEAAESLLPPVFPSRDNIPS